MNYKDALFIELEKKFNATIKNEVDAIHIYSGKNFGYLTIFFNSLSLVTTMADDPIKKQFGFSSDPADYIITNIDLSDPGSIDKIYKIVDEFLGA